MIRPNNDRLLAGVCAGIAAELGISPLVVRLGFVLLFWFFGIALLAYLVLWIAMPSEQI